jgi:hypothetical protein
VRESFRTVQRTGEALHAPIWEIEPDAEATR